MELPEKKKLIFYFHECANWEEKYLYLIELGKNLSILPKKFYNNDYKIFGCQSQVWIVIKKNSNKTITFQGDSDTAIVKGLVALVFSIYKNMTIEEIIKFDIYTWIKKHISLTKNLSLSRSHGLQSIIQYIQNKIKII